MVDINSSCVDTARFSPIFGSSYIMTPKHISDTKGVINIKNDDEKCFLWSVLVKIYPVKRNRHELYNYRRHENELNTTRFDFPVKVNDISKFEQLNPDISINVLAVDKDGVIYPLRATKEKCRKHQVW